MFPHIGFKLIGDQDLGCTRHEWGQFNAHFIRIKLGLFFFVLIPSDFFNFRFLIFFIRDVLNSFYVVLRTENILGGIH
jgi:hypothetical protein